MPTNAALLDEFTKLSALTGAAVALCQAQDGDHAPLRALIEARMAAGWRGIETCPEGGWAWVRGGPFFEPALRVASGERWHRDRREGRPAPTHWAPCEAPTWNEEG